MPIATNPRRLWPAAVTVLFCTCLLSGCAQFTLLGLLIGGPPHIEPEFSRLTGEKLVGREAKVVVVCYAAPELKLRYSKLDAELASHVTRLMQTNRINAVEPEYVRAWLDEHPDWETADEVGREFEADYVIEVEVSEFDLYEPHSTTLYRGHAIGSVFVHKLVDGEQSERVYTKDLNFMYPTKQARSAYELSEIDFRRDFLSRLSEEIGFMFYPSYNGDKIAWAT
jgi:hypothetical protein